MRSEMVGFAAPLLPVFELHMRRSAGLAPREWTEVWRDRHLRPRAAQISKRASVLSKEPRLRATGSTLNTLF